MIPKSAVKGFRELLSNVDDFGLRGMFKEASPPPNPRPNSVRYSPREVTPSAPPMQQNKGKSVQSFEQYTGGPMRRDNRPKLPKEMSEDYRKYGQQRIKETGSLKGQMRVNYEGVEYDLRKTPKTLSQVNLLLK